MTQNPQKPSLNELPQVYDASFKLWITEQAPDILPVLLPGAIYEATLDAEVIRPPMRADKVFQVRYHEEEHILHLEFEVGYDEQLKSRLLVYNSVLYRDHHLPVITIVVYPFRVTTAKPPLRILSQKKPLLTFHFRTLPLFKLDAREMFRQRHVSLYPLLPTMKHVDADLISQVIKEWIELYPDDEITLSQNLLWLELLLERTTTIRPIKKEQIKARLRMFDQLFEESPMIQKLREEYRVKFLQEGIQEGLQKGRQEGLQKGLQALQDILVDTVQTKYPDLAVLALQKASTFDTIDALKLLTLQIMTAPDADTVRKLLEAGPER